MCVLVASFALAARGAGADTLTEETVYPLLDWQPLKVIPSQEADLRCRQCRGRFAAVDRPVSATIHQGG